MSELKIYRDPQEGPCWREFYEKSEADQVIDHQKYKRCLAMARYCEMSKRCYGHMLIYGRVDFYKKWHKRLLELAEKFKEAK